MPFSGEELGILVWVISTESIGKLIGCSGKAVEKNCKKQAISKPDRGYWAQVYAGKQAIDPGLAAKAKEIITRYVVAKVVSEESAAGPIIGTQLLTNIDRLLGEYAAR